MELAYEKKAIATKNLSSFIKKPFNFDDKKEDHIEHDNLDAVSIEIEEEEDNYNKETHVDSESKSMDVHPVTRLSYLDVSNLKIHIQNCVYTCYLYDPENGNDKAVNVSQRRKRREDENHLNNGFRLNLNDVCKYLKLQGLGGQFNKKRFAAVITRMIQHRQLNESDSDQDQNSRSESIKIALLIFSQGNIVCTGAKSKYQALFYVNNIVEQLKKICSRHIRHSDLKVENIVSSTKIDRDIDIVDLSTEYTELNNQDEIFPGAIFRHPDINPITILIFSSGKLVITGAKEIDEAKDALKICLKIIEPWTKEKPKNNTIKPSLKATKRYYEINNKIRREKDDIETEKKRKKDNEDKERKKKQKIEDDLQREEMKLETKTKEQIEMEPSPSIILRAAKMGLSKEDFDLVIKGQKVIS